MKKQLSFILALMILISCQKPVIKDKIQSNDLQVCDFGIKNFNLSKRNIKEEARPDRTAPCYKKGNPNLYTGGTILLDFNGHLVSGTPWNYNGDIICSPAGLNSSEQQIVLDNLINEYAAYKVRVTTCEAAYFDTPINKRIRIIFTESYEWYGTAGGLAFINSYFSYQETPCFVFTSLLNYNTKYIKEAGAHEVGHTLGLYHQSSYDVNCVRTSEYNYGNGVEAPIMGVGYYTPDIGTKWWIGPNSYGCNSIQDDNAILGSGLGFK
jgi:hypothetical protein